MTPGHAGTALGGVPPSPHQLRTMTASISLGARPLWGPGVGDKQATQTLRGAPSKMRSSSRVRTGCGCAMSPGHMPCPGARGKVKTGTGRTKGPHSGSCSPPKSARACRKSSVARAQRRPRPLTVPAGPGSSPPPQSPHLPELPEILLGLRARTGLGPAGLGLRAPPRLSPPPVGRSRRPHPTPTPQAARERWGPLQTPTTSQV